MTTGEKRISIRCACGKSLKVRSDLTGKKIRCPGCNTVLLVPRATTTPNEVYWQQKINALTAKLEKTQAKLHDALKEKETLLKAKNVEVKELREKLTELNELQSDWTKVKRDYEAKIAQCEKDYQNKVRTLEKVRTQLIKISQQID